VAAQLSKLAAIETVEGTVADVGTALASYTELFSKLFWVGLAVAAVLLALSPLLKRMMRGIH
jgi:POT family proton-dependent oligopeptide transporter